MKKFKLIPIFCFIICLFSCFFAVNIKKEVEVSATSSSSFDITDSNYSTYMEKPLYEAIKAIAKQLNFNQPVTGFSSNIFSFGYNNYQPLDAWYNEPNAEKKAIYMNNIAKSDEIKDYLDEGFLDLTIGVDATFSCLNNNTLAKITDVDGLNELSLDTIKTLKINNHNITKIRNTDFSTLDNLASLSLINNNIVSFELGNKLNKINNLDLSENKLNKIDLSNIVYNGKYLNCNLSLNEFEKLSNVIAPVSTKFESLNLSFNKLNTVTTAELELINNKINSNKVFLGVQGLTTFKNVVAGETIKVYNSQNSTLSNLKIQVYYFEGNGEIPASEFYEAGEDNLICEVAGTNAGQDFVFPAGKLKLVFVSDNKEVNVTNFPLLDEGLLELFSSRVVLSKLPQPKYTLMVDGKIVTEPYQKNNIKVEFAVNEFEFANYQDVVDNCEIYSAISGDFGSDPANVIDIVENGTFKCYSYVVFDGIKSEVASVEITRKNYTGVMWGVIIIISIIILGSAVFYAVRWYREGATVAPLTDKEIYKLNKKRESNNNVSREEIISQLDKSRHMARVSDKTNYEDDQIYEDLNSYKDYSYNNYETEETIETDKKDVEIDNYSMPDDIDDSI